MSDPDVDRWKQHGRINLWREKGRCVDWNLAADDVACHALLDLFDRMEHGNWPSRKSLALVKPTRTATGFPDRPATFANRLVLNYRKAEVADDFWKLEGTAVEVRLTFGLTWLKKLRDAILDMKVGGGDYAIGPDEARLWIWWYCE
jgi:hypothetical protein